jgi:hypothetical protein
VPLPNSCSAAKSTNDVLAPALLCGQIGGHRFLRSVDKPWVAASRLSRDQARIHVHACHEDDIFVGSSEHAIRLI